MPRNKSKYMPEFRGKMAKTILDRNISATQMAEEIGIWIIMRVLREILVCYAYPLQNVNDATQFYEIGNGCSFGVLRI